ncbi:MAG: signal peptidase [Planctomycetaceae bacterium]|nr:signal peptidase [Planctomycetaceae bacterium]
MSEEAPDEKTPADASPATKRYIVRMGGLRQLGLMSAKQKDEYGRGQQVVCRTQRGLEAAEILCRATDRQIELMENYVTGHIHYELTEEDQRMQQMLANRIPQTKKTVQAAIDRLNLEMKLVDVEFLFAGERVVVYYLSEDRVDFRQLIKDLGAQLQTRIEMKQIGVRDEAKLLADYGDCGKPLCCNTHLSAMPRVTMKMAKLQKASLDPNKLSGRCGRLKCCLRYEFDHYEEVFDRLPPIGSRVLTRDGTLTVLQHEILSQQLLVETQDRRRILIPASDVLSEVSR